MPVKLKSSARRSRRNKKIGIVAGVVILALIVITAAFYMFGQPAVKYDLLIGVKGSGSTNSTQLKTYNAGELVTVQATANSDWVLTDWLLNGSSAGSTNPYTLTMSENRNLTAVFTQLPTQDKILLHTSMGNITIQLRDDKPNTSGNFKMLVQQGKYNDTVFHRIIDGFMIQGGKANLPVSSIPDEIGSDNRNIKGTIAMAKTSEANSATSEFFINVADNGNNVIDQAGTKFDTVYTVFGTVIEGMDVVDAISKVPVEANEFGENSKPVQAVTLISAEILP